MGVSLSLPTAQYLVPMASAYNVACQIYGMTSTPNMKTISDAHVAAFSPAPMAIAGFFTPQTLLQFYWISRLYRRDTKNDPEALKYAPIYILGNLCIGTWLFAWNSENLKLAQLFVTINSVAQLAYCYFALPPSTPANRITRLNAQTFAGIGLLDFIHNGSVAFFENVAPNQVTRVATAVLFPVLSFFSQPVLAACYVYDLFGIYFGQKKYNVGGSSWTSLILTTAIISGAAVVARVGWNYMSHKKELGGVGSERQALIDGEGN